MLKTQFSWDMQRSKAKSDKPSFCHLLMLIGLRRPHHTKYLEAAKTTERCNWKWSAITELAQLQSTGPSGLVLLRGGKLACQYLLEFHKIPKSCIHTTKEHTQMFTPQKNTRAFTLYANQLQKVVSQCEHPCKFPYVLDFSLTCTMNAANCWGMTNICSLYYKNQDTWIILQTWSPIAAWMKLKSTSYVDFVSRVLGLYRTPTKSSISSDSRLLPPFTLLNSSFSAIFCRLKSKTRATKQACVYQCWVLLKQSSKAISPTNYGY